MNKLQYTYLINKYLRKRNVHFLIKYLFRKSIFIVIGLIIGYSCDFNYLGGTINNIKDNNKKNITFLPEDDTSLADDLFDKVKVLCWIKTYPGNEEQVKATINTWGKRCNKLLIMSSEDNAEIHSIGLPVNEGREYLWTKVRLAYQYIYDHYLDSADWFLKTDDDTYVIMENLRYMLSAYSPDHPYYIGGRIYVHYIVESFMSGGAGYVISRAALKQFIEESLPYPEKCPNMAVDDVTIAICLNSINATFVDSRDAGENERFFPFNIEYHVVPYTPDPSWYARNKYYKYREGVGNMTKSPITFHYISPHQKYAYDYFIYDTRIYGRQIIQPSLPNKIIPPSIVDLDIENYKNSSTYSSEFIEVIKSDNSTQEFQYTAHVEFK